MKPMSLPGLALALGVAAVPLAQAAPGPLVYIPTGDSAEVLIIDGSTHRLVGRVSGLPAAHGLAVTPDGSRLIVGSYAERACCDAVPEKPADVSAEDHAAHHAPRPADAVQIALSTVSIVDTAARAILRRIDVPGAVHHVAVSPDGRTAVVTHPNAGSVTAIDLGALSVIATVATGALPNYAAFSPDGGELYVSVADDNAVAVVETATWTVQSRIATGASPEHLVLSPDGSRLFVNNVADGTVSVIDPQKGRAVRSLVIGSTLHGLDLSEDGGTLFVAVRDDDKLVGIDLDDGTRRSVTLSPSPYHLSVIADTGVLYVSSSEEPVVWVVYAAALETVATIPVTGIGHQFAQAPGS